MTNLNDQETPADRELRLKLELAASRDKVWRCWTEAELLKQWFMPKPWSTPHAELDLRPGGRQLIVMRDPDGVETPSEGVYLHVEPKRRIVTTSAFAEGWIPQDGMMIVITVSLDDTPSGGTAYEALVRHWSKAARDEHQAMGFTEGWTTCARQLEAVAASL